MNNVFLYRMPVGIAGAVSRPQDLTVEPVVLKSGNAFAAYGLAGKYDDDGFFVPLADGDTADKVKGIYVRPYAVSQVGGSVDAARGSLESLARFIRNNPGAEGFLNRLGVSHSKSRRCVGGWH